MVWAQSCGLCSAMALLEQRGWTRCPSLVPSNLTCSVKCVGCVFWSAGKIHPSFFLLSIVFKLTSFSFILHEVLVTVSEEKTLMLFHSSSWVLHCQNWWQYRLIIANSSAYLAVDAWLFKNSNPKSLCSWLVQWLSGLSSWKMEKSLVLCRS